MEVFFDIITQCGSSGYFRTFYVRKELIEEINLFWLISTFFVWN